MRKIAVPYSITNGATQLLVSGPFAAGDEILEAVLVLSSGAWTSCTVQVAMIVNAAQPIASSDEDISGGVPLTLPAASTMAGSLAPTYVFPLGEFVQVDKRYLAVQIFNGSGGTITGHVAPRVKLGRIGRKV